MSSSAVTMCSFMAMMWRSYSHRGTSRRSRTDRVVSLYTFLVEELSVCVVRVRLLEHSGEVFVCGEEMG